MHPPDIRDEVLSHTESFSEQTTPKRLFSPLKKSNKVAPSPMKPASSEGGAGTTSTTLNATTTFTASTIHTLTQAQTSIPQPDMTTESVLESESAPEEEQTGSTPQAVGSEPTGSSAIGGSSEPPLTPVIVVRSKDTPDLVIQNTVQESASDAQGKEYTANCCDDITACLPSGGGVDVEALYSSVVKPKRKTRPEEHRGGGSQTMQVSDLITELPQLETFEPPATDSSLVMENRNVHTSSPDHTHTDEHAYEMVDAPGQEVPDMPVYSAAVYKELKKHQGTDNVHLVSVKGTVPNSQLSSFPEGRSTDLSPLHYAAAGGDKKELSRLLSNLPVIQDPVEMVLGSERMCGREGVEVGDSEGRTPLMHAVHNNHLHSVKMLAEVGANVNAVASGELASVCSVYLPHYVPYQ